MSDIGRLNGKWAILMRVLLATYPFLLLWAAWITREQVLDTDFRQRGDRWTLQQGEENVRRIERLEVLMDTLEVRLDRISDQLARIETRVMEFGQ